MPCTVKLLLLLLFKKKPAQCLGVVCQRINFSVNSLLSYYTWSKLLFYIQDRISEVLDNATATFTQLNSVATSQLLANASYCAMKVVDNFSLTEIH